jgi:hypothetical protein
MSTKGLLLSFTIGMMINQFFIFSLESYIRISGRFKAFQVCSSPTEGFAPEGAN